MFVWEKKTNSKLELFQENNINGKSKKVSNLYIERVGYYLVSHHRQALPFMVWKPD